MIRSKCNTKIARLFLVIIFVSTFQSLYSKTFDFSFVGGVSYSKPIESIYDHYQYTGNYSAKHIGSIHPFMGFNITLTIHNRGSVLNHYGNAGLLIGGSGNRVEIGDQLGGLFYHFREFNTLRIPITLETRLIKHHLIHPVLMLGTDISYILDAKEGVGNTFPNAGNDDLIVSNYTTINMNNYINKNNIAILFGGGLRIMNNLGIYLQHKIGLWNIIDQPLNQDHTYYKKRITSVMLSAGI